MYYMCNLSMLVKDWLSRHSNAYVICPTYQPRIWTCPLCSINCYSFSVLFQKKTINRLTKPEVDYARRSFIETQKRFDVFNVMFGVNFRLRGLEISHACLRFGKFCFFYLYDNVVCVGTFCILVEVWCA